MEFTVELYAAGGRLPTAVVNLVSTDIVNAKAILAIQPAEL